MALIRLITERLILRAMTVDGVSLEYVSWLNDPEVNRYLESRFIEHNFEDVAGFVRRLQADDSTIFLGIYLKDSDKHIGNIKLDSIDSYHSRGIVGLMLGDKQEWGKGFATEAIREITKYAFNELGLKKVSAGCYESNLGSKKAFERVGYEVEGFFKESCRNGLRKRRFVAVGNAIG